MELTQPCARCVHDQSFHTRGLYQCLNPGCSCWAYIEKAVDMKNWPRPDLKQPDMVNYPPHYTSHPSGVECIDITMHMNFCIGNVVKYLWRVDDKDDPLENLEKAKWYIEREIERRKGQNES